MYQQSIGIIGGFGAYATLGFYRSILEAFVSDSERNYPHIYMDNDFTMPSRTRALLYGEGYDEVVRMIASSMKKMELLGADYIVMVCGTAHAFLPDVYKLVPGIREKVVNIIEVLRERLLQESVSKMLIIAAEGTLQQKVYPKYLSPLVCVNPEERYYDEIRYFIESVKRNSMEEETFRRFHAFLRGFGCRDVILGCTEYPILVDSIRKSRYVEEIADYRFWDPLTLTIQKLQTIMK